jgi:hypothetical protein
MEKIGYNKRETPMHHIGVKRYINQINVANKLGCHELKEEKLKVRVDGEPQIFYSYCLEGGTPEGLRLKVGSVFHLKQVFDVSNVETMWSNAGLFCVSGFPDF